MEQSPRLSMLKFVHASFPSLLKIVPLAAAMPLLAGCPATTGTEQVSTQPARTFQRGGETQHPIDTTVGAGHAASNGAVNFGGGMGGTANARIH